MVTQRDPRAWQVIVAGAGAPGLALALALKTRLRDAVDVTLVDPALGQAKPDGRAYALSPSGIGLLDGLGIWREIAGKAQPITGMRITDSRLDDVLRPDYLRFTDGERELARMIEAETLSRALAAGCRRAGVQLVEIGVARFEAGSAAVEVAYRNGESVRAALLVAADGSRSRLRDAAGIAWFGGRYPQSGIVGTLRHERPHDGIATQHFLPSGPFALLPLADDDGAPAHRSSLVWTERTEAVADLLALPRGAVEAELGRRAGPELGAVRLEGELRAFPLAYGRARRTVGPRLALLGDAAHEIHPLAGQGLNLGLADADALARRIVEAVRVGLDPGGAPVLDAYDRDRRPAILAMLAATDGLNRLFSNDRLPLRVLRDIGLGLVDRSDALKGAFMAGAQGRPTRVATART